MVLQIRLKEKVSASRKQNINHLHKHNNNFCHCNRLVSHFYLMHWKITKNTVGILCHKIWAIAGILVSQYRHPYWASQYDSNSFLLNSQWAKRTWSQKMLLLVMATKVICSTLTLTLQNDSLKEASERLLSQFNLCTWGSRCGRKMLKCWLYL